MARDNGFTPISQAIQETPIALVENGRFHNGFFRTPLRTVNLLDADQMGGKLGRPLRWLRLKEWVGFGFDHPRLYGAMIIQDAKYAGSGTVYLYDRATRRKYEWLVVGLPGQVRLPENLWHGVSNCGLMGNVLHFDHDLTAGRHTVHVRIAASGETPALSVDFVLRQDTRVVDPLVVSLPIGATHHTYTHKSPLRLAGTVRIGDEAFDYQPERDLGSLDEQKTFYPYRSRWHWGSLIGLSTAGREVMLNVVDQMTPKDQPGEDALWVDGKLMLLDPPQFIADGAPGTYRLEDAAGRIRLRFVADGAKTEVRNWGLVAIDYAQFFGRYTGEIVDPTGAKHGVDGIYGVIETMRARF